MTDDSGTHKYRKEDLISSKPSKEKEGFSQELIDEISDILKDSADRDGTQLLPAPELDDTGPLKRRN